MLCYHYLPANNGGVNRSRAFARYLPENGWDPHVLSTDYMGSANLPNVIHTFDPWRLHRVLKRSKLTTQQVSSSSAPSRTKNTAVKQTLIDFLYTWIFVPDRQIMWGFFAFLPALITIWRRKIDVIYSTSPPASAHVLAWVLSGFTRRPWILDLRDPWSFDAELSLGK